MPATKIAVIESRLPYTDRRALSEAWFSALHLAHGEPCASASRAAKSAAATSAARAAPGVVSAKERAPSAPARMRDPATRAAQAARHSAYAGFDFPARRSTDAKAIVGRGSFERQRSYPPFRTSITLEGANGTRVHLIVRRVGATLHVVALCPPAVEGLVRKALASADHHFRARGERLRVDVGVEARAAE